MSEPTTIDDQPIAATFFGEGKWLTDFVTPNALEVQELHAKLTDKVHYIEDRLIACWEWVAEQVKYVSFVQAKISINGKSAIHRPQHRSKVCA